MILFIKKYIPGKAGDYHEKMSTLAGFVSITYCVRPFQTMNLQSNDIIYVISIKTKKNKEINMRFFKIFSVLVIMAVTTLLNSAVEKENYLKILYQKGKLHLSQKTKIDANSLPGGVVLKQVNDMALNKYQQVFLTDNYQNNIKMFSPEGKFIKIIGQKGQGPGDLMWPASICYNGKYMIVWEQGNDRFSFFSENGDFVKIVKPLKNLPIGNLKTIPHGNIIVETELSQDHGNKGQICSLDLYSEDFQLVRSIYKQNVLRSVYLTHPKKINISVPFTQDIAWDVMSNGNVVAGFQNKYEISIFDAKKGKLFSFEHQAEPIQITAADKKRVYDSYRVITGPGKVKDPPKELLDKIPFPKNRPAFGKIIVDPENNILVFPMMAAGYEQYSYVDTFAANGKFIKQVEFDPRINVPLKILFGSIARIWCLNLDSRNEYAIINYQLEPNRE